MMQVNTVICPSCGEALKISENAPRKLICPKCLAQVENPSATAPWNMPTPVTPLGQQARKDTLTAQLVGITLIVIFAFAIAAELLTASYSSTSRTRASDTLALLIIAFGVAAYAWLARPRHRDIDDSVGKSRPVFPGRRADPGTVPTLDYRTLSASDRNPDRVNAGAAFLGFLLGIGSCVAGIVVFASTAGSRASPIYMAIVFAAVMIIGGLGANIGQRRGFRGFRPAVIVGLVLGMMALGPAGFCYMTAIR